ncbi:hypothetical protein AJ87_09875 [Rhizobium yanglingense]|nr:hypothetical protein AJ87_09875 [Rhizobium yanglingense]
MAISEALWRLVRGRLPGAGSPPRKRGWNSRSIVSGGMASPPFETVIVKSPCRCVPPGRGVDRASHAQRVPERGRPHLTRIVQTSSRTFDGGYQCELIFQGGACQDSLVHAVLPWAATGE